MVNTMIQQWLWSKPCESLVWISNWIWLDIKILWFAGFNFLLHSLRKYTRILVEEELVLLCTSFYYSSFSWSNRLGRKSNTNLSKSTMATTTQKFLNCNSLKIMNCKSVIYKNTYYVCNSIEQLTYKHDYIYDFLVIEW